MEASFDKTAARGVDSCFGIEKSISRALKAANSKEIHRNDSHACIGVESGCQRMNILCGMVSQHKISEHVEKIIWL